MDGIIPSRVHVHNMKYRKTKRNERKEQKEEEEKISLRRAVEITREPLRFYSSKNFFFSFLFLIFSCYLLTLGERERGEPFSFSLSAHYYYVLRGLKLTSRPWRTGYFYIYIYTTQDYTDLSLPLVYIRTVYTHATKKYIDTALKKEKKKRTIEIRFTNFGSVKFED